MKRILGPCVVVLVAVFHPLPLAAQAGGSDSPAPRAVAVEWPIALRGTLGAVALDTTAIGPLKRAIDRHLSALTATPSASTFGRVRPQSMTNQGWIGRHPVLFGTIVGFWAGFLIGYLPGDDAVFDDFTATFNGLVIGGLGAGVGAATGAIVSAARR